MTTKSLLQEAIDLHGAEVVFNALSEEAKINLPYHWEVLSRPEQYSPPGDWDIWLYLAGRGAGKTRSGAEWVNEERKKNARRRIAFVAATAADVRDIMVEGDSGIITVLSPTDKPNYEPSKRRLTWSASSISIPGSPVRKLPQCIATCFSAEKPDQLRGPQHDLAWADEMAKWPRMQDAYDNLMFGLRIGENPKLFISTTPRPVKLIKELVKDPNCVITTGTTYDNRMNLAPTFLGRLLKRYEGTRLGRQELLAEILDDNPDALFTRENLDQFRVKLTKELLNKIESSVVALDPAVTIGEASADTGIICAGMAIEEDDMEHYYILADRTVHSKPRGWARTAIMTHDEWFCNAVVGEVNNGGDMIEHTLRTISWEEGEDYTPGSDIYYESVRATKGKLIRAEPVSALAEQGRLHIVGNMPDLEDQMCTWSASLGEKSPDRLDAMVWAVTWLQQNSPGSVRFI